MNYDNTTFEEYEQQCELRRQENETYLELFRSSLEMSGLSEQTIKRHLSHVSFYINTFLLREEAYEMSIGVSAWMIEEYFEYFFIRKCGWSTPGNMKTTAASLKKFYKHMADLGYVTPEEYQEMCACIKEHMPEWQKDCALYNARLENARLNNLVNFLSHHERKDRW